MKREVVVRLNKNFEEAAHVEQNIEYWMARDIQELLEYNDWRNFLNVIEKAKVACEKSGQPIQNHFGDVTKMVQVGSGVGRGIQMPYPLRPKNKPQQKVLFLFFKQKRTLYAYCQYYSNAQVCDCAQ